MDNDAGFFVDLARIIFLVIHTAINAYGSGCNKLFMGQFGYHGFGLIGIGEVDVQ